MVSETSRLIDATAHEGTPQTPRFEIVDCPTNPNCKYLIVHPGYQYQAGETTYTVETPDPADINYVNYKDLVKTGQCLYVSYLEAIRIPAREGREARIKRVPTKRFVYAWHMENLAMKPSFSDEEKEKYKRRGYPETLRARKFDITLEAPDGEGIQYLLCFGKLPPPYTEKLPVIHPESVSQRERRSFSSESQKGRPSVPAFFLNAIHSLGLFRD